MFSETSARTGGAGIKLMQRVLHNPPDSQLYRYDSASRLINYVRGGNDMEFRRFSVTGTTFGIVK